MIKKNDPRLTDFVLGELSADEMASISAAIDASDELKRSVAELEQATQLLNDVYQSESTLSLTEEQKKELAVAAKQPLQDTNALPARSAIGYRWLPIASAAALLSLLIGGAAYYAEFGKAREKVASSDRAVIQEESSGVEPAKQPASPNVNNLKKKDVRDANTDDDLADRIDDGKSLLDQKKTRQAAPNAGAGFGAGGGGSLKTRSLPKEAPGIATTDSKQIESAKQSPLVVKSGSSGARNKDMLPPHKPAKRSKVANAAPSMSDAAPQRVFPPKLEPAKGLSFTESRPPTHQALIDQATKILKDADLSPLQFEITLRQHSVEQVVQVPVTRYRQMRRIEVIDLGDGKTDQKEVTVNAPYIGNESRKTNLAFVRAFVTLSDEESQRIVDQLAINIDPLTTRPLVFENLIGFGGLLEFNKPDPGQQIAKAAPLRGKPGTGQFGSKPQSSSPLNNAALKFTDLLNSQVRSQIVRAEQDKQTDSQEKLPDDLNNLVKPTKPVVFETIISPDAIPVTPQSINDLDFSEVIKQLKARLKQRNAKIEK